MEPFRYSHSIFIDVMNHGARGTNVKSRFAEFGDVRIYYEMTGKEDDALVFVHGCTCTTDFWREQINAVFNTAAGCKRFAQTCLSDKPKLDYSVDYPKLELHIWEGVSRFLTIKRPTEFSCLSASPRNVRRSRSKTCELTNAT
ncbi:MAG: alpha/beta fold hydrolase [Pyrinomonadaceae bacterium]